ncbi:MAG: hypothetical protein ACFB10_00575 [Salibacteraceae bacterium]
MTAKEDHPSSKNPIPVDQIDFGPFFSGLRWFFAQIWSGTVFAFRASLKRWWLIGLWSAIGVGLSVLVYLMLPKQYETDTLMTSGEMGNEYCYERINNIRRMVNNESFDLVAEELNLELEEAETINDLVYLNFHRRINPLDSIEDVDLFRVAISVFDVSVLEKINLQLKAYLENNEFALTRKGLARNRMQIMIAKLNQDIEEMDSLKVLVAQSLTPRGTEGGFVFGEPADPIAVYEKQNLLLESRIQFEDQLRVMDNIEIVTYFTPFQKHTSPKLFLLARFGGIVGFTIGFIWALLAFYRKNRKGTLVQA